MISDSRDCLLRDQVDSTGSRSCSVYHYSADQERTLRRIQTAVDWIEQEMGRLKTQDHSLHHQFDHVKKSLNSLCPEPLDHRVAASKHERKGSSSAGEEDDSMAALHSDTSLLQQQQQVIRNKSNNNSYSLSQDSYMSRGGGSEDLTGSGDRPSAAIQRRETLAAFHQQREKAAAKKGPRKAQSSEPEQSYFAGRRREHIYETLDDVVEDYKVVCGAVESGSKDQSPKKARKHTVDIKKDNPRGHKPVISNLIRPHHQSADRLPSQYHPVSMSRKTSPKAAAGGCRDPQSCSTSPAHTDGNFFSLQSADSGYNSTERGALAKPDSTVPHTVSQPTRHSSMTAGHHKARQSSTATKAEGVLPSGGEHPGRNHNAASQKPHDSSRHRRQESSPAHLSPDLLSGQKAGNTCETVQQQQQQQPKLVPLSKVTSPKSKSKGGKSKSQKPKSKSGRIGFLSTLNKVSGTESVSDFDFRPSSNHLANTITTAAAGLHSHALSQSHPIYSSRERQPEPVSYIGVVGAEYSHQTPSPHTAEHHHHHQQQQRQVSSSHASQRQASRPEDRKVNFKDPNIKKSSSSRHSNNSSRNTGATTTTSSSSSKQKKYCDGGLSASHSKYQSLSQPAASEDFEDNTLVLYKARQTSFDDSGVDNVLNSPPRRGASAVRKSPPLQPMYNGGVGHPWTPIPARSFHQNQPGMPVMEETWC